MNIRIAEIIRQQIAAFPWADKHAGLVQSVTLSIEGGGVRIFPVACDVTHADCISGKYNDLVPNSRYKSVLFFEDGGFTPGQRRGQYQEFESRLRLVVWANLAQMGDEGCHSSAEMIADVMSLQPATPLNTDVFQTFSWKVTSQPLRSADIFSRYSYREVATQFLFYPYDFFALDIVAKGRINVSCFERYDVLPSIQCPQQPQPQVVTLRNSDGTWTIQVVCGATYTVQDITFTDSNGNVYQVPAQTDITATPCTPCTDFCDEVKTKTAEEIHDCMTPAQINDYFVQYCGCPACPDATYTNSDGSYSGSVASGDHLSIPDINFTDSNGVTTQVPAVVDIVATPCPVCPTLEQQIASDGGFYVKHGTLPDSYSSFFIDPVQDNDIIWFAKYNNATLYRNKFSDLTNVATIATGVNITSNPRLHNGILYAGSSGGVIVVIDAATDTVLGSVALGVSTIIESICIDGVNNRLYCVTTSGAKAGFLWQFNISVGAPYLTYVSDFNPIAPLTTGTYVACDDTNQRIYFRALVANANWAVFDYALNPIMTATSLFPNNPQCRGFRIDNTFNEALMLSNDGNIYRVSIPAPTADFNNMPGCSAYQSTNRDFYFDKIPFESRKYFSIVSRFGTGNRYAITTR